MSKAARSCTPVEKSGAGASAAVDYKDGVAVFAFGAEGLMLEGVIGGQTFSFDPIK